MFDKRESHFSMRILWKRNINNNLLSLALKALASDRENDIFHRNIGDFLYQPLKCQVQQNFR